MPVRLVNKTGRRNTSWWQALMRSHRPRKTWSVGSTGRYEDCVGRDHVSRFIGQTAPNRQVQDPAAAFGEPITSCRLPRREDAIGIAWQRNPLEIHEACFGQPIAVLLFGIGLSVVVDVEEHEIEAHGLFGRKP